MARSPTCCAKTASSCMDSTSLLTPLLAAAGVLTTRAPTEEEQKDFAFGYRMADAIAALDIGQTDCGEAPGRRGGRGDGRHRRSDRPRGASCRPGRRASSRSRSRSRTCGSTCRSSGSRRFRRCASPGAAVLSIDAGKTLVLDREAVLASANEAKIAIVGRPLPVTASRRHAAEVLVPRLASWLRDERRFDQHVASSRGHRRRASREAPRPHSVVDARRRARGRRRHQQGARRGSRGGQPRTRAADRRARAGTGRWTR